jgi:hypothetical protein
VELSSSDKGGSAVVAVLAVGYQLDLSTRTMLALAPVLVLLLGLIGYCLVDLARAPAVRYLPKPLWALVILLGSAPFGLLAYLFLGRSRDEQVQRTRAASDHAVSLTDRKLSKYERGLRL